MPQRGHAPEPDEIDEGPSEEDLAAFSGVTRACPECKTELHDDTEICWKCGHALSRAPKGAPAWALALAVLVIAIIAFALLR